MNEEEKQRWYEKAKKEAEKALEDSGFVILESSAYPPEFIPFANEKARYLLEFEVGTDVATSLPRLLWVVHAEVSRAPTAKTALEEAKLRDEDKTPAEVDGLLYRRCAAQRDDGRYDTVIRAADGTHVGRIYARELNTTERQVRAKLLLPPGKELGLFKEEEAAGTAITDEWYGIDAEAFFDGRAAGLRCDGEKEK